MILFFGISFHFPYTFRLYTRTVIPYTQSFLYTWARRYHMHVTVHLSKLKNVRYYVFKLILLFTK